MRALEIGRFADIDDFRTLRLHSHDFIDTQRLERSMECRCQIRPLLPILDCIINKVIRRFRLIARHQLLEVVQSHRLQGVIESFLLANRRDRLFVQILSTHGTSSVGRIDERRVWQFAELVERVEQHFSQLVRRDTDGSEQIRPPHITNKQRVAGQHSVRLGITLRSIINQQ